MKMQIGGIRLKKEITEFCMKNVILSLYAQKSNVFGLESIISYSIECGLVSPETAKRSVCLIEVKN